MALSTGKPVLLQTERFELRSMRPIDASDRWVGWARDPEVMGPLNSPVVQMSRDDLSKFLATSDNVNRYIIGIFDKVSRIQVGFFMVDIDNGHHLATFNVVIGEKEWWGKGVINEARAALLDQRTISIRGSFAPAACRCTILGSCAFARSGNAAIRLASSTTQGFRFIRSPRRRGRRAPLAQ